jgi:ubiquitin-like protein Pup
MAERVSRQTGRDRGGRTETTDELVSDQPSGDRLKGELDDLLDEIDDVLESNAEEFVKGYVQKGGQ